MARLQRFIVEIKKEENKLKQEDRKTDDPFDNKEGRKIPIQQHLKYSEDGEGRTVKIKPVRKVWCEDEQEEIHTREVNSFMEHKSGDARKKRKEASRG